MNATYIYQYIYNNTVWRFSTAFLFPLHSRCRVSVKNVIYIYNYLLRIYSIMYYALLCLGCCY